MASEGGAAADQHMDSGSSEAQVTSSTDDVPHSSPQPSDGVEEEIHRESVCGEDDNFEHVKNNHRRRSKRRSDFARGRVSLTQMTKLSPEADAQASIKELCKQVPTDLSPAKRRRILERLELRHALELQEREFEEVPGFEHFKAEAVDTVGAALDEFHNEQESENKSAPQEQQIEEVDATIAELHATINRLKQESSDWDQLVESLNTMAQQAKQQLEKLEMQSVDIPEDVMALSASFLPAQASEAELAALGQAAVRDVQAISFLMKDYGDSVDILSRASHATSQQMDRVAHFLREETGCRQGDPKESIQLLLSTS